MGAHLPDVHLYWMLMDMLPDDVATEVRDRRQHLNSVDQVIHYLSGEIARYRDKENCTIQDRIAEQSLH